MELVGSPQKRQDLPHMGTHRGRDCRQKESQYKKHEKTKQCSEHTEWDVQLEPQLCEGTTDHAHVDWSQSFPLSTKHFGFDLNTHAENPQVCFFYLALSSFLDFKVSLQYLLWSIHLLTECIAENQVSWLLVSTTNQQYDLGQASQFLPCFVYLSKMQEVTTDF